MAAPSSRRRDGGPQGSSPAAPWLRAPAWDLGLVGFVWVPFYLWVVFGLGLGGEAFGMPKLPAREYGAALALAVTVALGFTYVHRHYTFLLVYGDADTFARRARAYVVAPLVVFGLVALARTGRDVVILEAGSARVTPWVAVLVVSGTWNVWHTVQQRYGILRVYAAKSKGGLEQPEHGRRDRLLVWSLVVLVAIALLAFRAETFQTHSSARAVHAALEPLVTSFVSRLVLTGVTVGIVTVCVRWLRHELAAPLGWRERVPRWSFLASTVALLAVFVVHGPVVGYLCFGAAHALEYLAFVHHFSAGKLAKARPNERSLAAVTLGRPAVWAPVLVTGLGAAYLYLGRFQSSDVYLTYYLATSMLHFLYDGWIWKVRTPEVSRPLGVRVPAA